METCQIYEALEVPEALSRLYQAYWAMLPGCKQSSAALTLTADLLALPGLVCFQNWEPVAVMLWESSWTTPPIAMASLYVELSTATEEAVNMVLDGFLSGTSQANSHYFELWTPPRAKIRGALQARGFERMERELCALTKPVAASSECPEMRFMPLQDVDLAHSGLESLAQAFCEAYAGTVDGCFYEHYRTPERCSELLSRVMGSPYCDWRNSWVAYPEGRDRMAGLALCQTWPRARAVYLEQLAVHPDYRGRGLGRELFARASNAVRPGGMRNLFLTVTKSNHLARQMYFSHGAGTVVEEIAYTKKSAAKPLLDGQSIAHLSSDARKSASPFTA